MSLLSEWVSEGQYLSVFIFGPTLINTVRVMISRDFSFKVFIVNIGKRSAVGLHTEWVLSVVSVLKENKKIFAYVWITRKVNLNITLTLRWMGWGAYSWGFLPFTKNIFRQPIPKNSLFFLRMPIWKKKYVYSLLYMGLKIAHTREV